MQEQTTAMSWISGAIRRVHEQQPELWRWNLGERTRVAEIFVMLRSTDPFAGFWQVDLEWNKEGQLGEPKQQQRNAGGIGTPDIVVHHRGESGTPHNFLVAEFKNTHRRGATSLTDLDKVQNWMRRFSYQFGAVVALGPSGRAFSPAARWLHRQDDGSIVGVPWFP